MACTDGQGMVIESDKDHKPELKKKFKQWRESRS